MKKVLLKVLIWLYGHPDKVITAVQDIKDIVDGAKEAAK